MKWNPLTFGSRTAVGVLLILIVSADTGYAMSEGIEEIQNLGAGAILTALGASMRWLFPGSGNGPSAPPPE